MQLGTRWALGDAPPARLSAAVALAIRDVEAQLAEAETSSWRWTLTWLESQPVVELDDGTKIQVARDGSVTVEFEHY